MGNAGRRHQNMKAHTTIRQLKFVGLRMFLGSRSGGRERCRFRGIESMVAILKSIEEGKERIEKARSGPVEDGCP